MKFFRMHDLTKRHSYMMREKSRQQPLIQITYKYKQYSQKCAKTEDPDTLNCVRSSENYLRS